MLDNLRPHVSSVAESQRKSFRQHLGELLSPCISHCGMWSGAIPPN